MFDFFDQILGFFEIIMALILNFVSGLLGFVNLLQIAVSLPPILSNYVPAFLGSAITIFMVIWIVKGIFGR